MAPARSLKRETDTVTAKQRAIQKEVAAADAKGGTGEEAGAGKKEGAMQAGARPYPEPPFPKQHQAKPGHEYKLDPEPLYDAPYYLGSKKLEDKVALITGGDSGIGRSVAVLFAREGADIAIRILRKTGMPKLQKRRSKPRDGVALYSRAMSATANSAGRRSRPRSKSLAGSTCWSTTQPSRCTPRTLPISAKSISIRR